MTQDEVTIPVSRETYEKLEAVKKARKDTGRPEPSMDEILRIVCPDLRLVSKELLKMEFENYWKLVDMRHIPGPDHEFYNDLVNDFHNANRETSARAPILKGTQIYHNFIKPHEGLQGRTPAEAAGIKVEGDNKWITIIQNASIAKGDGRLDGRAKEASPRTRK